MWLGTYKVTDTLYFHFTTRRFTTGEPYALAGGALRVYKNDSAVQDTGATSVTSGRCVPPA